MDGEFVLGALLEELQKTRAAIEAASPHLARLADEFAALRANAPSTTPQKPPAAHILNASARLIDSLTGGAKGKKKR